MTSFTIEQLRVVARVYAKYLHVRVRRIQLADNCPGDARFPSNNYAHTHYRSATYRSRYIKKGTICIRRKVLRQSRSFQISIVVHELHHLLRGKGALSHNSKVFKERAALWSYGTQFGAETPEGRKARYALCDQAKHDVETATEIIDTEAAHIFQSRGLPYREC